VPLEFCFSRFQAVQFLRILLWQRHGVLGCEVFQKKLRLGHQPWKLAIKQLAGHGRILRVRSSFGPMSSLPDAVYLGWRNSYPWMAEVCLKDNRGSRVTGLRLEYRLGFSLSTYSKHFIQELYSFGCVLKTSLTSERSCLVSKYREPRLPV
jgi:hypothetical protein